MLCKVGTSHRLPPAHLSGGVRDSGSIFNLVINSFSLQIKLVVRWSCLIRLYYFACLLIFLKSNLFFVDLGSIPDPSLSKLWIGKLLSTVPEEFVGF